MKENKELSFEENIKKLESIVKELENKNNELKYSIIVPIYNCEEPELKA